MGKSITLKDKVAWVTGASKGIGRAIAIRLARAGATVCLGARSMEEMEQIVSVLAADDIVAHAIPLDVADKESVEAFAKKAMELAGPVSVVVNNAGYGLFQDIDVMEPAEFDRQVDVTLRGPWYISRLAVPDMKRLGGGHIINIGSIAGRVSFKRGSAYCAAKAGLHAMSEALMLELRNFGIKVTVVAPGSVETAFHKTALPKAHHNDQSWMLEPEAIADACLHVLGMPENALVDYYEVRPLNTGK